MRGCVYGRKLWVCVYVGERDKRNILKVREVLNIRETHTQCQIEISMRKKRQL